MQLRWEQHQHELARSNAMQQQYEAQDQQWCLRTAAPPPSPPRVLPPPRWSRPTTTCVLDHNRDHDRPLSARRTGSSTSARPSQSGSSPTTPRRARGSCAGNQDALSQSPSSQQVGSERTPYTHKQHLCIPHLSSQRKRTCAEKNPICDSAPRGSGVPARHVGARSRRRDSSFPICYSARRGTGDPSKSALGAGRKGIRLRRYTTSRRTAYARRARSA